MKTRRMARVRNQTLLFIGLAIFTFLDLIPLIWAALTSVKSPADAFTVPPPFCSGRRSSTIARSGSIAASFTT
jgi:ABC-type glycerol-3-phosphate transport system permease component